MPVSARKLDHLIVKVARQMQRTHAQLKDLLSGKMSRDE